MTDNVKSQCGFALSSFNGNAIYLNISKIKIMAHCSYLVR